MARAPEMKPCKRTPGSRVPGKCRGMNADVSRGLHHAWKSHCPSPVRLSLPTTSILLRSWLQAGYVRHATELPLQQRPQVPGLPGPRRSQAGHRSCVGHGRPHVANSNGCLAPAARRRNARNCPPARACAQGSDALPCAVPRRHVLQGRLAPRGLKPSGNSGSVNRSGTRCRGRRQRPATTKP